MNESGKRLKIVQIRILTAIITVLLLILIFLVWQLVGDASDKNRGLVFSEETVEWTEELENLGEETDGIKIPGYGDITVSKSSSEFEMSLVNPKENNCCFEFTLQLKDTGEIIYRSNLIEPGKAVTGFEPIYMPPIGEYELIIKIDTYTMDESRSPLNNAVVNTKLYVVE